MLQIAISHKKRNVVCIANVPQVITQDSPVSCSLDWVFHALIQTYSKGTTKTYSRKKFLKLKAGARSDFDDTRSRSDFS